MSLMSPAAWGEGTPPPPTHTQGASTSNTGLMCKDRLHTVGQPAQLFRLFNIIPIPWRRVVCVFAGFLPFSPWNGFHVGTRCVFVTRQYSSTLRNVCFPRRLRPSGCYGIDVDPTMYNAATTPNICSTLLHYHQNELGGSRECWIVLAASKIS